MDSVKLLIDEQVKAILDKARQLSKEHFPPLAIMTVIEGVAIILSGKGEPTFEYEEFLEADDPCIEFEKFENVSLYNAYQILVRHYYRVYEHGGK